MPINLQYTPAGADPGGGMPLPPSPIRTEHARNTEWLLRYSAHLYMNHCFVSSKHKAFKSAAPLHLPWDSSVAAPQIQRLIPKGRGSEKPLYDQSPQLYSSCHIFCMVMVLSNGLRRTLICSKFHIFLGEHPYNTALNKHRQLHTMCATPINPHSRCMPPFLNLWICPWGKISISQAAVHNSPLIEGVSSFSQEKQVFLIVKMFDCCKL